MALSAHVGWRAAVFAPVLGIATALLSCGGSEELLLSASPTPATTAPLATASPPPTPALPPYPAECRSYPATTDGLVLATAILSAPSADPLLDRVERDRLASEIDGVVSGIRGRWPVVSSTHVYPRYVLGRLWVGFTGDLSIAARVVFGEAEYAGAVKFGVEDFDQLNQRLGVRGLYVTWLGGDPFSDGFFSLCFDDTLNLQAAALLYSAVAGIRYAYLSPTVGDGSDIAVRKVGETWYVVFRNASGDCPAGCTSQQLYYFVVDQDLSRQIDERDALNDPVLRPLAETWGAQRLPTSFPPTGGR